MFDYRCYIHLRWSCYNTDRWVSHSVLKWRTYWIRICRKFKMCKICRIWKIYKICKYAEFAKYTKYAENVMLIWTDHVSKRDFPFIEPANIKLILWRSSCQRWPAAARQDTTWWRRSLPWHLRVVTFNQKVQKFFLSLTFSMCYCASIICCTWEYTSYVFLEYQYGAENKVKSFLSCSLWYC